MRTTLAIIFFILAAYLFASGSVSTVINAVLGWL